jgi:hypothetical protein
LALFIVAPVCFTEKKHIPIKHFIVPLLEKGAMLMTTDPKKNPKTNTEPTPPTGDHDHDVQKGEEILYAQTYGMAWNPADHERYGMSDFDRDEDEEPLDTEQEYRISGKEPLDESESENENAL